MAQSKKTSTKTGGGARAGKHAAAAKTPRRRAIAAVVFFLLAAFSFIGYFDSSGAFIGVFCGLIKGLIGPGFYAMPPALLLCAVILCFHRGRPVRMRVVCAVLLTVFIGAVWHLFGSKVEYDIGGGLLTALWNNGKMLASGGALGGTLAVVFKYLFSQAGAAIVFICLILFFLLSAANITIPAMLDRWRRREKREYIPEPVPERPQKPVSAREPARRAEAPAPKRKKVIDIPLDGEESAAPEVPEAPKEKFFKSQPRVKTPDQLVEEYASGGATAEPQAEEQETAEPQLKASAEPQPLEDVPLDIPFMEKSRAAEQPATPVMPVSAAPVVSEIISSMEAPPVSAKQQKQAAEPFEPQVLDSGVDYTFPPLSLLTAGQPGSRIDGSEEVRINSDRLEAAFRSFGVNVKISNTTRGPSVTRYEAELEAGVKLNKLTSLADDIALSLGASGVRIAAMPNKISTVGIEVPNKLVSKVLLRDIIESPEFLRAPAKLTFAIGTNISGEAVVGNVSKLPHMLVAGTTGSGKSVCLNSIILSILYKATPDDVRFIMIDPKMVEFRVYNSIPHLLVPVVTDVKKAAGALQWAVVEMMKRYRLFSETNARDLEGYNTIAARSEDIEPIPQIIVIIDELADLMMTAAKEVEESIVRVAQMGRAAGVHLIIATQSPRADVITGLMKANIPSRIALKVSSALESRIILDAGGSADKLVGNGDMLYAPTGTSKPVRIQGTWVSDEERERVVEYIKQGGEAQYSEDVISEIEKAAVDKSGGAKDKDDSEAENDHDELLPQAVDVIFESNQASVSMLQRRLKLGYSRAARIVDQMEQMGIVGPFEGSKPRAILITREQWRQMQYINGTAPTDTFYPDAPEDSDDDGDTPF